MVDHFGRPAFEVAEFFSSAVQTFFRLVQPKMGVDFTLDRARAYDCLLERWLEVFSMN